MLHFLVSTRVIYFILEWFPFVEHNHNICFSHASACTYNWGLMMYVSWSSG